MKKFSTLFLSLVMLFIYQGESFGQCNSISNLMIIDVSFGACAGTPSMQDVTVEFNLTVGASGNASACLGYEDGATGNLISVVCFNENTDNTDNIILGGMETYSIPCGESVILAGWSNPDGGGNVCADPLPVMFGNPTPVELISFKVYLQNDKVTIEWLTATEENNDYFELQTSTDGQRFQKIATIDGIGTTDETQYYKYVDQSPARGDNYYRIKQVDFDGTSEIFETIVINVKAMEKASVYPSQTYNMVNLELSEAFEKDVEIELYSLSGVLMQSGILTAGDFKITFDVSDLPGGVYFVRYINADLDYISKQFFKMVD